MLLAIDIGNTNVVLGVFDKEKLVENWRVGTNAQITPDEYAMIFKDLFGFAGIEFKQIHGVIISTVVPPLLPVMVEMSRKYFKIEPLVVTHELKTGIAIHTDNPKEVGADRIVNAAAAFKLYGGPLIIVDFGTATTFCAITKNGEYLGGAICPGVKIAAEALFYAHQSCRGSNSLSRRRSSVRTPSAQCRRVSSTATQVLLTAL